MVEKILGGQASDGGRIAGDGRASRERTPRRDKHFFRIDQDGRQVRRDDFACDPVGRHSPDDSVSVPFAAVRQPYVARSSLNEGDVPGTVFAHIVENAENHLTRDGMGRFEQYEHFRYFPHA